MIDEDFNMYHVFTLIAKRHYWSIKFVKRALYSYPIGMKMLFV